MRGIDYKLAADISNRLNAALDGQPKLECLEALRIKLSQSIAFDGQEERNFIGVTLDRLRSELQRPLTDWNKVSRIVLKE